MRLRAWVAAVVIAVSALASIFLAMLDSATSRAVAANGTVTTTSTPTPCATPTPEPLWVDPVESPTIRLSQAIIVYLGHGDAVTVTAESGMFAVAEDSFWPARVNIGLLPGVTHHLRVSGHVRTIHSGNCTYGNYTLSTAWDKYGNPLIIEQHAVAVSHLPVVLKDASAGAMLQAATPTLTPTPPAVVSFQAQVVPSATDVGIGDSLEARAEVYNNSDTACLGEPQFALRIEIAAGVEQNLDAPILEPARPTPVVNYVMVSPGSSTYTTFTLRAARPGIVTLRLSVVGEVAEGENCGPPYSWGGTGARSDPITVAYRNYLPLLRLSHLAGGWWLPPHLAAQQPPR